MIRASGLGGLGWGLGVGLALAALLGAGFAEDPAGPSLGRPAWRPVASGLDFARVEALRYGRAGSRGVAVVRIEPSRVRIEPHHEREYPKESVATLDAWQERLGAPVLLNAGLYDEDRRHLGLLRRDGRDIGGTPHATWKGFLGTGSSAAGVPDAAVLDLSDPGDASASERFPNAVQSMMLLDRRGEIRVRKSDRAAPRSVVAQDAEGRIYLVVTEGAFTLWETGRLLAESGWGIRIAMALDGGNEANLAVESGSVRYRSHQGGDPDADPDFFRASVTLPSVLAVWPRPE